MFRCIGCVGSKRLKHSKRQLQNVSNTFFYYFFFGFPKVHVCVINIIACAKPLVLYTVCTIWKHTQLSHRYISAMLMYTPKHAEEGITQSSATLPIAWGHLVCQINSNHPYWIWDYTHSLCLVPTSVCSLK